VLSDQQGSYVWVVDAQNKVEQRRITLGQSTPTVGVVVAGPDGWSRLAYGVTPPVSPVADGPGIEVWITPPAATGLAPRRLDPLQPEATVVVPQGTVVRASAPKGWGRASLHIGPDAQDFTLSEDGGQHAEMIARKGERLAVRRLLHTVAEWPINLAADQVPEVAFVRPPGPAKMEDGEIRVQAAVSAKDDWGLDKVWLEIKAEGLAVDLDPERVDLPVSGVRPKSVQIEERLDAQGSEFSGLTVAITPKAQDGAGQVGEGPAEHFVWPDIPFADENAARLAQARKALLNDPAKSDDAIGVMEEIGPKAGMPSVELALSLAMRDLTPPDFRPNEAQGLMLESARKLEQHAQARLARALEQLGQELDKAGDSAEAKALTQLYADMIGGMLDRRAQGGAPLPLSSGQVDDIRRRLDRLAAQPGNKGLARRLEEMAQRIGQSEEMGRSGTGRDPLGRPGADDGTTVIPGQGAPGKARQLLDEIRRRAQDLQRPKPERDYMRRLLED
jgi:hypothetical protein